MKRNNDFLKLHKKYRGKAMSVNIPKDRSKLDAFNALYTNAKVTGLGKLNSAAGQSPSSPWNAIQIFQTYCHNGYCDYVRGKLVKANFKRIADKDSVVGYERKYGEGSAQKAIDTYRKQKLYPEGNFDLNSKPCKYFTSFWKAKTPEKDRIDLEGMFEQCEKRVKAEKEAEEQIKHETSESTGSLFGKCKVSYALVSPPVNYIGHSYKPCQEALNHLKYLQQNNVETDVEILSLCRYNAAFMPRFKRCTEQKGTISLETAIKVLEANTSMAEKFLYKLKNLQKKES